MNKIQWLNNLDFILTFYIHFERDLLSCWCFKLILVNIIVIKIMKILALSVLIALCLLQMANSADPKNPIWADHFTQGFT